jgi:titin
MPLYRDVIFMKASFFSRYKCVPMLVLMCLYVHCSSFSFAIPKAPANLAAVASTSEITLTWTDTSTDETGFELESSPDGLKFIRIADLKFNTVSYVHDSLAAKTKYWYRLRSKNASGYSVYSNIASATTLTPVITIPKAPSALVATAVSGYQISLAWTDNATDETAFEIESSTDGNRFEKIAEVAANTVIYQNLELQPATKYWYRVLAKNTAGKSPYSNPASAVTLQVPPDAPENLAATAISQTQINLSWVDNADNETGFQVERSLNGTTFTKIADLAANAISFQNTGLTAATLYYYRVRAVNVAGASGYSNVASIRTQNIPVPDRPTQFTAVPLAYRLVQLRWAPLTGNATSVVIERTKSSDEQFIAVATLPASVLQFEDTTKLEKVDYFYRIKAVNAGGSSPYSLLALVPAASVITAIENQQRAQHIYVAGRTLFTDINSKAKRQISIFDLSGRMHFSISANHNQETDLTFLPAGIYIVLVAAGKEIAAKRIGLF